MRLKEFEEKVMEKMKPIEGFRILSFRIWHNHVRRCLGKIEGKFVVEWGDDGKCHMCCLTKDEQLLDDDEIVERFNYASVKDWMRQPKYDIA